jgi:cysteinyl-tRNA synthetase, unknown class
VNAQTIRSTALAALAALAMAAALPACDGGGDYPDIDFREEMRDFVIGIAETARSSDSAFIIIPQNGIELVTLDGEAEGPLAEDYLAAIDGNGQEDLFYGYDGDDRATPAAVTGYVSAFLDVSRAEGNRILVTDYCSAHARMDDSYGKNGQRGYLSFAAERRELDAIPGYPAEPRAVNADAIGALANARNFLYLINPDAYANKEAFIQAVTATDYDLLIMDLFDANGTAFTAAEVSRLRAKANGGTRLVICYMSIGEAEDYRFYWEAGWADAPPTWLEGENPDWEGNFKVRYWEEAWQRIIYGPEGSYLDKILDAGFDGVYLDIIEAFEYFEG